MTLAHLIHESMENVADEPALVQRLISGEAAAFEQVVGLYSRRVSALAFGLMGWDGDVEDVVQDVFLAALERAPRFRGDAPLWTWLASITVNRCRLQWRKRRIRKIALQLLLRGPLPVASAADRPALDDEKGEQVRAAVAGLSPKLREVIVLYYLQGMPTAEVCRTIGASSAAVEVRLHRGREKLREMLGAFMGQPFKEAEIDKK